LAEQNESVAGPKMEPSKAAMKVALRVLTALSERQEPDQTDVDELHWYAPADRERPIDELVCDAIQRALKDREDRRKAKQAQIRERLLALGSAETESEPTAASLTSREERDRDIERLAREAQDRRQEYLALNAKLARLGEVFQQAAALLASATGSASTNSEAARSMLEAVAGDVDISGIRQLLDEHVRLSQHLIADEQTLKKLGIK
jgi:hypothetical protein